MLKIGYKQPQCRQLSHLVECTLLKLRSDHQGISWISLCNWWVKYWRQIPLYLVRMLLSIIRGANLVFWFSFVFCNSENARKNIRKAVEDDLYTVFRFFGGRLKAPPRKNVHKSWCFDFKTLVLLNSFWTKKNYRVNEKMTGQGWLVNCQGCFIGIANILLVRTITRHRPRSAAGLLPLFNVATRNVFMNCSKTTATKVV